MERKNNYEPLFKNKYLEFPINVVGSLVVLILMGRFKFDENKNSKWLIRDIKNAYDIDTKDEIYFKSLRGLGSIFTVFLLTNLMVLLKDNPQSVKNNVQFTINNALNNQQEFFAKEKDATVVVQKKVQKVLKDSLSASINTELTINFLNDENIGKE